MASPAAYIALFIWPVVVIWLFRKRPLNEALAWSVIGGYLLLPQYTAFDLPVLPEWDKTLVPSLFAAIMCYVILGSLRRAGATQRAAGPRANKPQTPVASGIDEFTVRRGRILFWGLVGLLICSPFITTLTNTDRIVEEFRIVQGLRLYDSFSMILSLLVATAPFFLARRFLASSESHVVLLKVFAISCLGYSLLALWEVRMSPQLHSQIYGFFPHRWSQHTRYGGYRPVIFLNHGLWVAIIMAMGAVATMALWRVRLGQVSKTAILWMLASVWMIGVVLLCKSAGAIIIALLLVPVVLLFGTRMQLLAASGCICILLVYPSLRGADLVPTNAIYSMVAKVDAERARSLQIRFNAEDILLTHANQKPLAGWGNWGRSRVQGEHGGSAAATDGYWVIVVGGFGWLGYVAQFGLMGAATILLAFNRKRLNLTLATAGLAVVLCAGLIDLIPNATISPVVWLIAGALMGRYQSAVAIETQVNLRAAKADTAADRTLPDLDAPVTAREAAPKQQIRSLHVRKPREGF